MKGPVGRVGRRHEAHPGAGPGAAVSDRSDPSDLSVRSDSSDGVERKAGGARQLRKAARTRRRMEIALSSVSSRVSSSPAPSGSQGLASVAPMPRMEAR